MCALEEELPSTSYRDARDRPKRVRYWRLRVVGGTLAFDHEVDEARWVSPAEAEGLADLRARPRGAAGAGGAGVRLKSDTVGRRQVSDFSRTPAVPRAGGARHRLLVPWRKPGRR